MTNKKKDKQGKIEAFKQGIRFELYGLLLFALSLLALAQYGWFGEKLTLVYRFFAGTWDFLLPLLGIGVSFHLMLKRKWPRFRSMRWMGILTIFFSLLLTNHFFLYQELTANGRFDAPAAVIGVTWDRIAEEWARGVGTADVGGGMIAAFGFALFCYLFDVTGTALVIVFMVLIGIMLTFQLSYIQLLRRIRQSLQRLMSRGKGKLDEMALLLSDKGDESGEGLEAPEKGMGEEREERPLPSSVAAPSEPAERQDDGRAAAPVIHDFTDVAYRPRQARSPAAGGSPSPSAVSGNVTENEREIPQEFTEEAAENYQLPPLSLLAKPSKAGQSRDLRAIQANAKKLEKTLESFGVQARVTQIHRGPAVTRYEVQPAIGVKVSKIVSLTDDIALSLAARGIRIEAPIPGKSAIGIEVPNQEIALVTLREVLESPQYREADAKLTVALGRDISGEPVVANLARMPHLLVAGATGSGKSVCINGIISSLLYKAKPHEVKLMMIDPKMVELNVYNGIPHLLAPVVTDPRRASVALKKVVAEMERRYELFAENGTRDIERYNQIAREKRSRGIKAQVLPYIVVIVDELADLMMVAPADVEDAICRLAQMARAAGIHLIIATQRPSVDVITGLIKANIPSRIAFGVSSQVDSRTILDMAGAEKLLGRGDMLFLPVGSAKPIRVQGAFVSEKEVEALVTFVKEQQKANYQEEMIPDDAGETAGGEAEPDDELYEKAVQLVIEAQSASVSMLQRRLRIGYTRAARLIDAMEANGIVGPYEGSKPRDVLVKKSETQIS
ncbi:DNA translocase SpoIIIE [Bacillaceae bacterium]